MTTRLQVRKGYEWLLRFFDSADWNQRRRSIESQLLAVSRPHAAPVGSKDFKSVFYALDNRWPGFRVVNESSPRRTPRSRPAWMVLKMPVGLTNN
jgi:hypothetical protein